MKNKSQSNYLLFKKQKNFCYCKLSENKGRNVML